jgi:hypothetical protein
VKGFEEALPFHEEQLPPGALDLFSLELVAIDLQRTQLLLITPDHGFILFVEVGEHAFVLQAAPLKLLDVGQRGMGRSQLALLIALAGLKWKLRRSNLQGGAESSLRLFNSGQVLI